MEQKISLNIVTLGNVDSGKSTTIGHLLFTTGRISHSRMLSLRENAENHGKS